MKVRVNVTTRDIELGCKLDGAACPVARALKRKGFKRVHVSPYNIFRLTELGHVHVCDMPDRISSWIKKFDAGFKVKPTSFTLEIEK